MRKFSTSRIVFVSGIILFLSLSYAAFASHTASPQSDTGVFTDVLSDHPNFSAIEYLKNADVVSGYTSGEFKPDFTIKRGELIKILVETIEPNPWGKYCFKDVKDEWFAKYVCTAKRKGMVKGYSDGTFKPAQNINLAEASKIITQAFELEEGSVATNEPWYKPSLQALEAKKTIPTSIDYVEKKLSRGEMAEMVWRLKTANENKPGKTYNSLVSEFPKIASCGELKEKFLAFTYAGRWRGEKGGGGESFSPSLVSPTSADAGDDYSQTNVQVAGVDEADIVKNDNKYIYLLRGNTVRIIDAYPPGSMQEVAKIDFSSDQENSTFEPTELYLSDSKLVIIGSTFRSKQRVKIFVYDITQRSSPELKRNIEFDGFAISSRRIGDKVYLVLNQSPYGATAETKPTDLIPHYRDSKTGEDKALATCTAIRFYPRYREPNYLVVASVSLANPAEDPVQKSVILGAGDTVYASTKNLYVTTFRNEYDENTTYNVFIPPALKTFTAIYRFSLGSGGINFQDRGEVPGAILNQFSMDEYNDTFRLSTTTGNVWDKNNSSQNHIYILDANDLKKMLGKIEGIAPGERIYSTRFLGKKGYMVTFKKVDPFFVLDLSDSANPKILGALKIPGFSDYLHPFDENHIIGFGKNTATPTQEELEGRGIDFAWFQGIKIGLFDVTDPANPKQKFEELIGDRGTDSELLYNHKALLFDKRRNLFGFPVTVYEIENKDPDAYTGSITGEFAFQGAYVYTLDLQNGFQLKGKITHEQNPDDLKEYDFYDWGINKDNVTRIISLGEFLYTLSSSKVRATGRDDMLQKGELVLTGEEPYSPNYYY